MMVSFPPDKLAVVGLDAAWGGRDGLDAFERAVYEAAAFQSGADSGLSGIVSQPTRNSASCESLLEEVTNRALTAAGFSSTSVGKLRIALITACSFGSAPCWDWAHLMIDLSSHPLPLVGALEHAARLLGQGPDAVDLVVFAAANVPAAEFSASSVSASVEGTGPGFGFDRGVHGWKVGAGAGAAVFMLADRAEAEGRQIYAVFRSLAVRESRDAMNGDRMGFPVPPMLDDMRGCCQEALQSAGITSSSVGYVEAFACGSDALDGIEIAGLVQSYRLAQVDLTTAMGSAQANAGYLGPAAGLAGLIRVGLCLYHRYLPGMPNWNGPKLPALWRSAPFYVPSDSRPWFSDSRGPGRIAGLNLVGLNGTCAHLILEEPVRQPVRTNRTLALGGFLLFPLVGNGLQDLQYQLGELKQTLEEAADLNDLAAEQYLVAQDNEAASYALSIVGHSREEILREIDLACKALPAVFEKGGEWQTPLGSYCTAEPAGRLGEVAMVYPGAFNSYPGVGKDLFRLFPGVHQRADLLSADLGAVFRERLLYPRSLAALTKEEMTAKETHLLADPIAMLISGTALSVVYTHILQETFAVRPTAAFGYSLGENSMIYAAGVWTSQGDEAAARLEGSNAFRVRLAGPQLAIREHWGVPDPAGDGKLLWNNYLVMAAPEKVQAALANEPRVYLTHINTPRQVVIGGDPEACQRVLSELRCSSLQAPFDYALHCDVMRSEFDELAELHNYPVENETGLRLYSAASYSPLGLDQEEIAQKMGHMLTSPLDFPRLVRKVYDDGARVFIEAGAGSNCARWIDETLKGSPHLALSMNRRGTDDYHTVVRMLARLFSHRVPMNLSALYQASTQR